MLAFVAAAGAELATGAPVAAQLKDAPILIGLTFFLFSAASLVCCHPCLCFSAGPDHCPGTRLVGAYTMHACL